MSTIQIRVIGNHEKATIAIHQEKLLNSEQRVEIKEYWTKIINKISDRINESIIKTN